MQPAFEADKPLCKAGLLIDARISQIHVQATAQLNSPTVYRFLLETLPTSRLHHPAPKPLSQSTSVKSDCERRREVPKKPGNIWSRKPTGKCRTTNDFISENLRKSSGVSTLHVCSCTKVSMALGHTGARLGRLAGRHQSVRAIVSLNVYQYLSYHFASVRVLVCIYSSWHCSLQRCALRSLFNQCSNIVDIST